jgi:hypothetical protein
MPHDSQGRVEKNTSGIPLSGWSPWTSRHGKNKRSLRETIAGSFAYPVSLRAEVFQQLQIFALFVVKDKHEVEDQVRKQN